MDRHGVGGGGPDRGGRGLCAGSAVANAGGRCIESGPAKTEGYAQAESSKPAVEAKAKKLPLVAVTVTNNRSVSLVDLTALFSGKTGDSVSVAKDLPGGKKTVAHLAHDKDCLFDCTECSTTARRATLSASTCTRTRRSI